MSRFGVNTVVYPRGQLDLKVKSSRAVLLDALQPDRDALHHLTFEDNHRVNGWPECEERESVYVFFL